MLVILLDLALPSMFTVSTLKTTSVSAPAERYHHGNLRQALLEEGLRLLEENPDGEFSLRELARRVGVSANSSYRHFHNKSDLMIALALEGMQRFGQDQAEAWQNAQGNGKARFLATGCAYVRFARRNPALFRLMFGRFVAENSNAALCAARQANFMSLKLGVAAALEVPVDSPRVEHGADSAWAVVHGLSHLILEGVITGSEADIERRVELALRQWSGVMAPC